MIGFRIPVAAIMVLSLAVVPEAITCSSFTLKDEGVLIVGRNADGPNPMLGVVAVNKRGVRKQGQSSQWLHAGEKAEHPPASWISKYGSVTFNYGGLEFPDGGMNEAGLVFQEMTLLETSYPTADSKAKLFMILWIQQILDTCATVDEVVENARRAVLDGWNWHFYAADAAGNSAVIEFLDGKPVILTGEALPYTVLCNSTYADELGGLAQYEGFGGTTPLSFQKQGIEHRFAKGATLLGRYAPSKGVSPMAYAWRILDSMSPGFTQSAQVYDISNRVIEFRTSLAPKIRSVRLDAFDFGCDTPAMIFDLNADLEGDISTKLEAYTVVGNSRAVSENLLGFSEHPDFIVFMETNGVRLESIVARYIEYPGTTSCEMVETAEDPGR